MRKASPRILISAMVVAASLTAAAPALAASPHYLNGPTATLTNNSLVISWKAVGLGNTTATADFTLGGTVSTTSQCYTKNGNPVNGVPKTETNNVSASGTFSVHNGQTTGSLSVSPLSTLTCTGNQHVVIQSFSYDLTLNGDSLDPAHLTGSG